MKNKILTIIVIALTTLFISCKKVSNAHSGKVTSINTDMTYSTLSFIYTTSHTGEDQHIENLVNIYAMSAIEHNSRYSLCANKQDIENYLISKVNCMAVGNKVLTFSYVIIEEEPYSY